MKKDQNTRCGACGEPLRYSLLLDMEVCFKCDLMGQPEDDNVYRLTGEVANEAELED